MPYSGKADTTTHGKYSITQLTLNAEAIKDATDVQLWYTNEPEYAGKTSAAISKSGITESNGWKMATATNDGATISYTGEGLINGWPTAIAYVDDRLLSQSVADLKLTYKVEGTEGDKLVNSWTTTRKNTELGNTVTTQLVKRTLEGTV